MSMDFQFLHSGQGKNKKSKDIVKMTAEIRSTDIEFFKILLNKFKAEKIEFKEQNIPNEVTLAAIEEAENMKKNKNTPFFDKMEDLIASLNR